MIRQMHPALLALPLAALAVVVPLSMSSCDDGITEACAPAMIIEVNSVTFPPILPGGEDTKKVTIRSAGCAAVDILEVRFETEFPAVLSMDALREELPITLEPDHEIDVEIIFSPYAGMPRATGMLIVRSNDINNEEVRVQIDTQIQLCDLFLEPTNLNWAAIPPIDGEPPGCAAPPNQIREFEVINRGGNVCQITRWELTGGSEEDPSENHFTVCAAAFEGPGNAIPPGSSRTWKVVFHPLSSGQHQARVTVHHANGSKQVTLTGGGEDGPCIQIVPQTLAWPGLPKDRCNPNNLTISNCGTVPLAIRQIRLNPPTLADYYSISGDDYDPINKNYRSAILRGDDSTLTVNHCALLDDPVEGLLEIHHSAGPVFASPIKINLLGNQCTARMAVEPAVVNIHGTGAGTSSQRYPVQIRNTGCQPLHIQDVTIGPQDGAAAGIEENFERYPANFDIDIDPTEFAIVDVDYSRPPQQEGRQTACLNIEHNDPAYESDVICVPLWAIHDDDRQHPPDAGAAAEPGYTVPSGTEVTLDCAASTDADGDEIDRCAWILRDRPPGSAATMRPPISVAPNTTSSILLDVPGIYRISLTVREKSDAGLESAPKIIELAATAGGIPPGEGEGEEEGGEDEGEGEGEGE